MNLQRIIDRYNPESDTIPGGPWVTWAERDLADEIIKLHAALAKLTKKVDQQDKTIKSLEKKLATKKKNKQS